MSETPDHDETDPLGSFDAFRARRAEEQAANEPFPARNETEQYEAGQYAAEPYEPFGPSRRGRLRSVAILAGAAVLVAGVVGGVYAATRSSGSPAAATLPSVTASPSPSSSPSAGALKGTKNGKAVTARLTVTSVAADSFTATAADGRTVTAQITANTKFGTAARPFTRSQLITGAVVYARLRREADGTVVATVIASVTANASASASGSAGTGA